MRAVIRYVIIEDGDFDMGMRKYLLFTPLVLISFVNDIQALDWNIPWSRHTIDNSSQGADGVKLADANGDGFLDIACGWEEGGVIRVYLHPGVERVKQQWPSVTVGKIASPEDAVFADLDGDGRLDVVSCSEGKTKQVTVHWAPKDPTQYLNSNAWKSEVIPTTKNLTQWMFCLPMQVDGKNGVDLVLGAKNDGAQVGWLQSPADPRTLSDWKWRPLIDAGWIMSLEKTDVNWDERPDILVSDRRGETRQCYWLEHPGYENVDKPWNAHAITSNDREFMFLDLADVNNDGLLDLPVATRSRQLPVYYAEPPFPTKWRLEVIPFPPNTGTGKSVRAVDVNRDGAADLIVSCENATDEKQGVFLVETQKKPVGNLTRSAALMELSSI